MLKLFRIHTDTSILRPFFKMSAFITGKKPILINKAQWIYNFSPEENGDTEKEEFEEQEFNNNLQEFIGIEPITVNIYSPCIPLVSNEFNQVLDKIVSKKTPQKEINSIAYNEAHKRAHRLKKLLKLRLSNSAAKKQSKELLNKYKKVCLGPAYTDIGIFLKDKEEINPKVLITIQKRATKFCLENKMNIVGFSCRSIIDENNDVALLMARKLVIVS